MKVKTADREIVLSRENLTGLLGMLDHPDAHRGQAWCSKHGDDGEWWTIRAEENDVHYEHRAEKQPTSA